MDRKAIWKTGFGEIAKASRGIAPAPHKEEGILQRPFEPPSARTNALMYIGLCPTATKLNPPWKTEVSKNAWINLCLPKSSSRLIKKEQQLDSFDQYKQYCTLKAGKNTEWGVFFSCQKLSSQVFITLIPNFLTNIYSNP